MWDQFGLVYDDVVDVDDEVVDVDDEVVDVNDEVVDVGGQGRELPHLQGNIEIGRHKDRNAEIGNTKHRIYRN